MYVRVCVRVCVAVVSPYSGPVDARFQAITPTGCTATIVERPWLHNPFRSLHAVALANLGELTGAIVRCSRAFPRGRIADIRRADFPHASPQAVLNACDKVGYRGIVTKLTTRYVKKARGVITAKVVVSLPTTPCEFLVSTEMTDESGDIVAITETAWTLAQGRGGKKQS